MAVCTYCTNEMTDHVSCSVSVLHRDGLALPVKPFGKDRMGRWARKDGSCGDCGTPKGGFHHLGCDIQKCPNCGFQMISCGCWFDEDGTDIADDEDMFMSFIAHRWEDYLEEAS